MRALLILLDLAAVSFSFLIAFLLRFKLLGFLHRKPISLGSAHLWMLMGIGLGAVLIFGLNRLYDKEVYSRRLNQFPSVFRAVLILFGVLFVVSFFFRSDVFFERRSIPILSFSFTLLLVSCFRLLLFNSFYRRMLARGIGVKRVAIIGERQKAEGLAERLSQFDGLRYRLAGMVAQPHELPQLIREKGIDEVFLTSFPPGETLEIASECRDMGVGVNVLSDVFGVVAGRVGTELIDGLPLVHLNGCSTSCFSRGVKRTWDLILSLLFLFLLWPLLVLISMGIKLTSKGPILFKQRRIGREGREFTFCKFRSMFHKVGSGRHRKYVRDFISNCNGDPKGIQKMTRDPRVTKFGHFLRKSSLDELPQLINVLKGEMSLVGPRPPIPYEVDLYQGWHAGRLGVKPGITGLWQVSGRSSVSFDEMVLLDIYYAENWSLGLDLEILLKTLPVVISRRGAY